MCALGLREQLVGISHECNWPAEVEALPRVTRSNVDSSASSGQIDQQVKTLLQTQTALYEVDQQLLVSLQPSLILTQAQCDVCAVSYDAVKQTIASNDQLHHTRVIATNPTSLDEVLDDIQQIAQAAGVESTGQTYRLALQQRIDAVISQALKNSSRPRTVVIEWTDPLMVAGNWAPSMVELAGGEYGLATAGQHSDYVRWETIAQYRPEVMIVAPCGFDRDRSIAELQQLRALPYWQELPAVAEHRVYAVDGDALFNRPGPRLVDSLEMLTRWVAF